MIDERTEAQAILYVLGALPGEEEREFETLMRTDLELQLFVQQIRVTSSALSLAFPRIDPPPALKQRILALIDQRRGAEAAINDSPGWQAWIPWALAACFAILCVSLLALGNSLRQQSLVVQDQLQEAQQKLADLEAQGEALTSDFTTRGSNLVQYVSLIQTQLVQRTEELKRQKQTSEQQIQQAKDETERQKAFYVRQVQQALSNRDALQAKPDQTTVPNLDTTADLVVAVLSATPNSPSRSAGASVWDTPEQRGVLQVENLAALSPITDYQLWVIDPQYPNPISGGVFTVDARGSARVDFKTAARITQAQRFAVSLERKGGAPVPTAGKIVLISN